MFLSGFISIPLPKVGAPQGNTQLGRRDGTRGWRNSVELREQVWDSAWQEGEERNAKRITTWEICHQKGTGNNVINGRPLSYVRGNV